MNTLCTVIRPVVMPVIWTAAGQSSGGSESPAPSANGYTYPGGAPLLFPDGTPAQQPT